MSAHTFACVAEAVAFYADLGYQTTDCGPLVRFMEIEGSRPMRVRIEKRGLLDVTATEYTGDLSTNTWVEVEDAPCEREAPELFDPEDNADQLRERSENISNARDAAYERGLDYFDHGQERPELIAADYYGHPKLQAAFLAGWDDARADEAVRS